MSEKIITTKNKFIISLIAILVLVLDRISKWIILTKYQEKITENKGLFFGMIGGFSGLEFFLIVIGILTVTYLLKNLDLKNRINIIALGLILSGGISNILDRIFYGYVIDFIRFNGWPTFNIADIFIFIGTCTILYNILFEIKKPMI